MVHYCAAYGCKNNSTDSNLSFHSFPSNKRLQEIWITRIKRDKRKDFKLSKSTKVCSVHFNMEDFINSESKLRRLKPDALPNLEQKITRKRSLPAKLDEIQRREALLRDEETQTASEGEGQFELTDNKNMVSRSCLAIIPQPCLHRLSLQQLSDMCDTKKKEENYLKHYTGLKSVDKFIKLLRFLVPNTDQRNIIYWGTKAANNTRIDTSLLYDSDIGSSQSDSDSEGDKRDLALRRRTLSVEDEFLLFLMKVRLGLTNLDLAIRFCLAESTVADIIITWLNFLYIRLGSLKIWPHRRVLIDNMPENFKKDYPNNIVIIDATELRIQCPSSLVLQSQTYSNYKSTNTLKSLVGVDAKGGFMFVSQLYTGSISDKEIVKRSGFLNLLSRKKNVNEINEGDSIMADKGFDIAEELKAIGMKLNIPPFLKDMPQFDENEVIKTQTVAKHRIHVERAIGKVRQFLIFNSRLPISAMGTVNQLWTVCCLLSNFMDPILKEDSDNS